MNKRIIFLLALIPTALGLGNLLTSCSTQPETQISDDKGTEAPEQSPTVLFGFEVDSLEVVREVVQKNENLSEILTRYNVSPQTIHKIGTLPEEVFDVRKIQRNKPYTIIHEPDSNKTCLGFVYHPNVIDYVVVDLRDSVAVIAGQHPVDTLEHTLEGVIESSLYVSITEAGGSPLLVNALSEVYAWEIDFFGLQKGDAFKILYTTLEVQGESAGLGEIKAASFTHMDEELLAFQFDQGDGIEYFDEEGNSLRKTFLKAPLSYTRISSKFSYNRLHPVLKIRRPHLGVDYAAPTGTPVLSVGDGTVVKRGYAGGAGKMVKIKHNGTYTTAYLHLSRYGKGLKVGDRVKQGQVIGYVGSTGLSTGPHLDFRFYQNGKAIDPLKVDPPSANPIKEEVKTAYTETMMKLKARLQEAQQAESIVDTVQDIPVKG
ncbi:peptidoglycan DD-metalloendopeptidase family protein [Pontibacter sp. G13]|uniref:peptidoglycan DD-metalloendopeptidase family protein n=1 Tax=Pontibacter sp. G13 TaxID=3074898 RepID=UPI00288BEF81|nr:peptidoglycan DD-metalloendopeptidase family protein [Pontibacter sp. G13]WNJ19396.1 peptidoglycan DD-metalloendopeptidase family protein [Pontibacter sp. G13]